MTASGAAPRPTAPRALTIEMVHLGATEPLAHLRRHCATVGLDVTAAGPDPV